MRLGKAQAAGYVEDTEMTEAGDSRRLVPPERIPQAPDPGTVILAIPVGSPG